MTDHQEGDRVEFDALDQTAPVRGVVEQVRRSPGRQPVVVEYVVRADGDQWLHHIAPQHCYPERTTTP